MKSGDLEIRRPSGVPDFGISGVLDSPERSKEMRDVQ